MERENRRHGLWRCLCGAELYAKPDPKTRYGFLKTTTYAPGDYIARWTYEHRNDIFLHKHKGKVGLLKAVFVESRDGEPVDQETSTQD